MCNLDYQRKCKARGFGLYWSFSVAITLVVGFVIKFLLLNRPPYDFPCLRLPHNFTYQVPAAIGLTSKSRLVAGFINRNAKAMQEPAQARF